MLIQPTQIFIFNNMTSACWNKTTKCLINNLNLKLR